MRKLIIVTVVFVLAGISANHARGGMHGSGMHGLMVPRSNRAASLTPDPRLTGRRRFRRIISQHRPRSLRFQRPCSNRTGRNCRRSGDRKHLSRLLSANWAERMESAASRANLRRL